jgi:hypothetical protein
MSVVILPAPPSLSRLPCPSRFTLAFALLAHASQPCVPVAYLLVFRLLSKALSASTPRHGAAASLCHPIAQAFIRATVTPLTTG